MRRRERGGRGASVSRGVAAPPCVLAAGVLLSVLCAPTASAESFLDALRDGKPVLDLRYRYENVDQASFDKEAHASTLRTVLGYRSGTWRGFSLVATVENVAEIGNDLYDNRGAGDLGNGVTDRPVVADPALTDPHQIYLQLARGDTEVRLGRQEVLIDDHRFVGNVGWRQNHQEFDAFSIVDRSLARTRLTYGYLDKAHRIFGDSQDMSSHLLNAAIEAGAAGTVTLYGYLVDYDQLAASGRSSLTYGAELKGSRKLGESATKLLYELELAQQDDAGDNPGELDAGYRHLLLGGAFPRVTVKLGWEVLEGSPEDGQFNTPLATLHKFNGWADLFLSTPPDGLEDLSLALSGKAGDVAWTAVFHSFDAESSSAGYGDEIDLQLVYTAEWKQSFGIKAAFYDADEFGVDTDKVWVWTSFGLPR